MKKISVIITIYNSEKYLEDSIKSILNQSYKDYEIILIDDNSTDDSSKIIDKYKTNKKIKTYHLENTTPGPSEARNFGIDVSNGKYIIFLDSDDFVESNFLENLSIHLEEDLDLLKYSYTKLQNNKKEIIPNIKIDTTNGINAFNILIDNGKIFDATCMYAYKKEFITNNKFKFAEGKYHEDFGLIPLMIIKSKKFKSIENYNYIYRMSSNSIMRTKDYEKEKIKARDILYHYDYLYKEINNSNIDEKTKMKFLSFLSNALINKLKYLKREDKKEYKRELKQRKIVNNLLEDNLKRKIKKLLYFIII